MPCPVTLPRQSKRPTHLFAPWAPNSTTSSSPSSSSLALFLLPWPLPYPPLAPLAPSSSDESPARPDVGGGRRCPAPLEGRVGGAEADEGREGALILNEMPDIGCGPGERGDLGQGQRGGGVWVRGRRDLRVHRPQGKSDSHAHEWFCHE